MILDPKEITFYDFQQTIRPNLPSYSKWRAIEKAISGFSEGSGDRQINNEEMEFLEKYTGRIYKPGQYSRNLIFIIGRQANKTNECSNLKCYNALTSKPSDIPGELITHSVVSPSYRTSSTIIDLCSGQLQLLEERSGIKIIGRIRLWETLASIELTNGNIIRSEPINRTALRGRRNKTISFDEFCFLKPEGRFSANAVFEGGIASQATFGREAKWSIQSSPGAREGLAFDLYEKYYGKENDEVLVFQAPSYVMNPLIDPKWLDEQRQAFGESWYLREIEAQFVDSLNSAFNSDAIDSAIASGRTIIPYSSANTYYGALDPSSLSEGGDEFVISIGHKSADGKLIQDYLCAWSPEEGDDIETVISSCIEVLRRYKVRKVFSDRFAANFIEPQFKAANFSFELSPLNKSDLYREFKYVLASHAIEILNDKTQRDQFCSLELKRSGSKDKIFVDHERGRRDDRSNCCALLSFVLQQQSSELKPVKDFKFVGETRESAHEVFGERVDTDFSKWF